MLKKLILSVTLLFLLFEVLFFASNNHVEEYKMKDKTDVYKVTLLENKEEFIKDYENLILEEEDDAIILLTSKKNMEEIKEKYNLTIEN